MYKYILSDELPGNARADKTTLSLVSFDVVWP